ncbi:MAG TPA: BolA/IbaG family iron-sulfur metabolism protein [Solirubrobacteraceae bacterium]|jgi:stress-induced morphogen
MPSAEDIRQRIEAAIPGASVEVEDYTGGGDHFSATVTAAAFAGLTRIQQHRLVYDVFGAEIGGPIHALALKTSPATGREHAASGDDEAATSIPTP